MYKILIVDDEVFIREGLIKTVPWKDLDCEVIGQADNSIDALNLIEREKPDIAIIDIIMPGYNGIELAKRVYEKKLVTRLIILTGHNDFSFAQSAIKYGVTDYLLKPSDIKEIIAVINKVIESISLEQEKKKNHESLSNIVNSNIKLLRKEILFSLLTCKNIQNIKQTKSELRQLNINIDRFFILTVIHDRESSICDLIHDTISYYTKDAIEIFELDLGENELAVLFTWSGGAEGNIGIESVMMNSIESIRRLLVSNGCKKANIGLSPNYTGLEFIYQAYCESKCELVEIVEDNSIGGIKYWSEIVRDCLIYMYEHYSEKLKMNCIAQRIHVSEGYLFRCFKKETGFTFLDVLEHYRLQNAKELLQNTGFRINEIAGRTGFPDTKYFTHIFKKKTGFTPSEYRKHGLNKSLNSECEVSYESSNF